MTCADPRPAVAARLRILRRLSAASAAALLLAASLAACSAPSGDTYPKLEEPNPSITLPGGISATPTPAVAAVTLRILSHAPKASLDAVAELYAGMSSGTLAREAGTDPGALGATIPLEELARFAGTVVVERVAPPATGDLETELLAMAASGILPDLFETEALPRLADAGALASLDDVPSVRAALQGGALLPAAVSACRIGDALLGLPRAATTTVLFYNADLLRAAGIEPAEVDAGLTVEAFAALLPRLTDPTRKQYALLSAAPLLPRLPATRDGTLGWGTYRDGRFRFASDAFSETAATLRSYVKSGWTTDALTADQRTKAFGNADPRAIGKVAFWIGDSTEAADWTAVAGIAAGVAPLPCLDRPAADLSVLALCVSATTRDLGSAVPFAAFLAADPDALRLQSRIGFEPGAVPLSTDPSVWADAAVAAGPAVAPLFASFRDRLADAFVSGRTGVPGWTQAVDASIGAYQNRLLSGALSAAAAAGPMGDAAAAALAAAREALAAPAG